MDPKSDLTLRQWLRNRPATVKVFDELSGSAFWSHLDDSLADFCHAVSLPVADVRHRLIATIPAVDHEDWLSKPMYRLIDRLTVNHAEFRDKILPRIDHLLGILKMELGLASAPAEEAQADFRTFREEFAWHMEEEESFLFPKILRTESCIHHPDLYPEVFKGSVGMFPPAQMRLPEETFQEMLSALMHKVNAMRISHAHAENLHHLIEELLAYGSKLKAHTYLESDLLFKRASQMEADLLKRAAQAQV